MAWSVDLQRRRRRGTSQDLPQRWIHRRPLRWRSPFVLAQGIRIRSRLHHSTHERTLDQDQLIQLERQVLARGRGSGVATPGMRPPKRNPWWIQRFVPRSSPRRGGPVNSLRTLPTPRLRYPFSVSMMPCSRRMVASPVIRAGSTPSRWRSASGGRAGSSSISTCIVPDLGIVVVDLDGRILAADPPCHRS
jgi:hypothetical protein